MKHIETEIADAIMERPQCFYIGDKRLFLYPATLGKNLLSARLVEELEINSANINLNPYAEALRLSTCKKDVVCRLVAYHTINDKKDLFDNDYIKERISLIETLSIEELSQLLIIVLTADKEALLVKELGIDKENEKKARICAVKLEDSSSVSFGGKSMYGTMIDFACERYGWTLDYVVWGISYISLKMMMNDYQTSIYLTDEEMKRLRIPRDRTFISGDDKANIARIKQLCKG